MNTAQFFIYLALLAGSTYLIRVIPFVLAKEKIKNQFVRSFLYYIPYAVLTAMTVPAIFYATRHIISSAVGFFVAVLLAYRKKGLLTVATFACIAVFVCDWIISL